MGSSKQQPSQSRSRPSDASQRVIARPTSVKVLTITYQIQWLNEDEWYGGRLEPDAVGITERDKALISMRSDGTVSEDALRATLLHELLHTTTEASRLSQFIGQVEDPEEFVVAGMAPVLMSILNENPEVVAYLLNVGSSA